jgi:hypothetical protein
MSRNSKNARNLARARMFSEMRKKGEKGPSSTQPKHGKKHTYRSNPTLMKSLDEFVKELNNKRQPKSGLEKVLENVGAAAE